MDLHKEYSTISVRNEEGTEEKFVRAHADIKGYVASLGGEDAVVMEASGGALYWAEKIQSQGAGCVVIDACRFRIIRDSWQKTDKRDAANLSVAFRLAAQRGEEAARGLAARTGGAGVEKTLRDVRVVEQADPSAEERDLRGAIGQRGGGSCAGQAPCGQSR